MIERGIVLATLLLAITSNAGAAFLVEAHPSGLANDLFEFGGDTFFASDSIPSTAIGVTAEHSIFGGDGIDEPDSYVFNYSPSENPDNLILSAGTVLGSSDGSPGNGYTATGLPGGQSGRYNVYITSPATTNVNGGPSVVTMTQEGEDVVVEVEVNNEQTGPNSQINPNRGFVGGLNNAWFLLGSVSYLADEGYSVTMVAGSNTFVSQRVHGVLWEFSPLSELPGDFDNNGRLDAEDIDDLTSAVRERIDEPLFDVNADGDVDNDDRVVWVDELRKTYFGDANLDGEFNSSDFVLVFQFGEYEDAFDLNSTWTTGDWNGDGDFDSSDFVTAFQSGGFELGPRNDIAVVPEPTALTLLVSAGIALGCYRRPITSRIVT